jgi:hypothetical protein
LFLQDYVIGKTGPSGIAEARNTIVTGALNRAEEVTHVFFVDDDVLFHSDVLLTLLSHNKPMVSGLYYQKSPLPSPLLWEAPHQGAVTDWTPNTLQPCWAHGMGLTLIRTEVFRRMQDELPLGVDDGGNPAWFRARHELIDGIPTQISEDVDFLGKARALGYQPLVDTSKAAFGWHYDGTARVGYPTPQWKELCTTGVVTWPTTQWMGLNG